jgi:general secretion pathway protein I
VSLAPKIPRHRKPRRCEAGFSLLEVLVAFSIMMLSLGVLYQAAGGSVRNLATSERQTHAILLAQSLLSLHQAVPPGGLSASGSSEKAFDWVLSAVPAVGVQADPERASWPLYRLDVEVAWQDGERRRRYAVATLLPEAVPEAGAR